MKVGGVPDSPRAPGNTDSQRETRGRGEEDERRKEVKNRVSAPPPPRPATPRHPRSVIILYLHHDRIACTHDTDGTTQVTIYH